MQHVHIEEVTYIGGDIVRQIVDKNNELYGNGQRTFLHLNVVKDSLPHADLILCRDCLVHLNFADARKAIRNFSKSSAKYLLTTTFPGRSNEDLYEDLVGLWRPLDLEKPPFNFPKPLLLINEGCTEGGGGFMDKSLGLWRLEDL